MNAKTRELMLEHNHKSARTDAKMEALLDYQERIMSKLGSLQPSLQTLLRDILLESLCLCIDDIQKELSQQKEMQLTITRNLELEKLEI